MGLNGTIPIALASLTGLTSVSLDGNRLHGTVPNGLGSLGSLEQLKLGNNDSSGYIPAEFGALSSLRILALGANEFKGKIPSGIGNLTRLTDLSFESNRLSGEIPAEFGGLMNLEALFLSGNSLSGEIPSELSGLSNLAQLDLGNNNLGGEVPSDLGALTNLWSLSLVGNQLGGCVPAAIRDGLTHYELGGLKFCDQGPGKPEPPNVASASGTSLRVTWVAPSSVGAPISDYDVQYREEGSTVTFADTAYNGLTTEVTISGLTTGTNYEVQVRARSSDGDGVWSESGVGQPGSLRVSYAADRYAAIEGGTAAMVTVSLSDAASATTAIPISVSAAAGTEITDYAVSGLGNGLLTFGAGESSKTFTVAANDDADSAEESMELSFGRLPSGVIEGMTTTTSVALTDNDALTATIAGPTGTVDGAFDVTITFSEEVTGFELAEAVVVGGTATLTGSGANYSVAVTPSRSGAVTVDVAANVVEDDSGSGGNSAAAQLSVSVELHCSSGVAIHDSEANTGLVEDCETLLRAKRELAGTGTLNWSADVPMSLWEGLAISGAPLRVTVLNFEGSRITGTIPAELGNLTGLSFLSFRWNSVHGSIPREIGKLEKLEHLDLHYTQIGGHIPPELGETGKSQLLIYRSKSDEW